MHHRGCATVCAAVVLVTVLVLPRLEAEEAVLSDGRHLRGALELTDARLSFTPTGQKTALAWESIDRIRFPALDRPPLRALTVHRVELANGQRLTGEFLGLDARALHFRTAWAGRLIVPRPAVLGLGHEPGFGPLLMEDFEAGLRAWKSTGEPALVADEFTSGRHSLRLDRAGQAVERSLPAPLEAGRLGVNFEEIGAATGARWVVEAEFAGPARPQRVRIGLAGPGATYRAEVADSPGISERLPRTPGWHRLQVEFGAGLLSVTVDDAVLWYSRRHGPTGPLCQVRLACVAVPEQGPARGAVAFDDFCLSRAIPPLEHRRVDLGQDELWLLAGDQLLGDVVRADRRTIEVHGRFGSRSFPWTEVRGLFPRQEALPPQAIEGEHVRLWLRTGAGPDYDQLEGTLQELDGKRLRLRHGTLGELSIDRGRIRALRRQFGGLRIGLDPGLHHLGPEGRILAAVLPPRAEGPGMRWTFRLDAVPRTARLLLVITYLKPTDRGGARTEVVLNGIVVEDLNRRVAGPVRESRRVRLDLPADHLRVGENVLELRLVPDRASGRYVHCAVGGIRVEVPR